jgi:drug/metabolite transporter (DMT)-like permease
MSNPSRKATFAGIGLMLISVSLFSVNDAVGKWLVAAYPVGEALLIRSLVALAPVALGEHVGWRRWAAVLVGFAGVLLALKPSGAALSAPALVALTGSLLYAGLLILTRVLRNTANAVLVSSQIASTGVFGLLAAPFGWVTPPPGDFALMVLFGVLAMGGLACLNLALKRTAASVVVPYQYTMIVWGVVLGLLIFGDKPRAHVIAGAGIIIAAGLFIFFREQQTAAREPPSLSLP